MVAYILAILLCTLVLLSGYLLWTWFDMTKRVPDVRTGVLEDSMNEGAPQVYELTLERMQHMRDGELEFYFDQKGEQLVNDCAKQSVSVLLINGEFYKVVRTSSLRSVVLQQHSPQNGRVIISTPAVLHVLGWS